jgi:hypothetical protein
MASKRFKGKTCAYCARAGVSEGPDHVFARQFILEQHRRNLPQVPACDPCNSGKSGLETYLLQVLPLGANHSDARETFQALMPKRAANAANRVLRKILEGPDETVWLTDQTGQRHQRIPVLLDADKLRDWCGLVARGLAFFHWGVATPDSMVETTPIDAREEQTTLLVMFNGIERVERSVGNGAFSYRGFKYASGGFMWLLYIYGSMHIGGDPAASRECAWSWRVSITPQDRKEATSATCLP